MFFFFLFPSSSSCFYFSFFNKVLNILNQLKNFPFFFLSFSPFFFFFFFFKFIYLFLFSWFKFKKIIHLGRTDMEYIYFLIYLIFLLICFIIFTHHTLIECFISLFFLTKFYLTVADKKRCKTESRHNHTRQYWPIHGAIISLSLFISL